MCIISYAPNRKRQITLRLTVHYRTVAPCHPYGTFFVKCVYHRCDRAAVVYRPFIQSGLLFIVLRYSSYCISVCCVAPCFGPTVRSAVRCEGLHANLTAGKMNMACELLWYCLFCATYCTDCLKNQLFAHTKHICMWYSLLHVSTVDRTAIFSESNLKVTQI
jgi:hypothetical protein